LYKRVGRKIYDKKPGGRWRLKQTCKSVENAEKALRAIGMGAARKARGG
jgi:hypothetical protein